MSRKRGGFALILLGMIVAAGVAWMVFNQAQSAAQTARLETVEVLVAAQDIPSRAVIAAPHLAVKRVLPSSLPPNALVRPDQAVGKMTTDPILAGEFVLPAKLVGADNGRPAIAYAVPKGKVVITVPASDILTTGAVQPGDVVDLLVTIGPPEDRQEPARALSEGGPKAPAATPTPAARAEVEVGTTQTTMQNLKVLGIGSVAPQNPGESKDGKSQPQAGRNGLAGNIITFAVEHQDALVLKALKDSERVKMELVLRSAGDEKVAKTDPITLSTIVDRYSFRAVPTPRPAGG